MVQAYNFLASWQLFPEKGTYEYGERPKSGIYRIESPEGKRELIISHTWVSLDNQGFAAQYNIIADGALNPFDNIELADEAQTVFVDSICFEIHFYKNREVVLHVVHEIMPNGYLKITQQGKKNDGIAFTNTELFHKQLSVLPYSASVAGAVIKHTELE